jgi:hypothetical protein
MMMILLLDITLYTSLNIHSAQQTPSTLEGLPACTPFSAVPSIQCHTCHSTVSCMWTPHSHTPAGQSVILHMEAHDGHHIPLPPTSASAPHVPDPYTSSPLACCSYLPSVPRNDPIPLAGLPSVLRPARLVPSRAYRRPPGTCRGEPST